MKTERGFTFPELLVVGAVFLSIIATMLFLIRPNEYKAEKHNAERRLEMAQIMQAINKYEAEYGKLPASILAEETLIASEKEVSLCHDLVPAYMKDLPRDPVAGVIVLDDKPCTDPKQFYTTGYTIKIEGGRVTISAPLSTETDEHITVSKWFPLL